MLYIWTIILLLNIFLFLFVAYKLWQIIHDIMQIIGLFGINHWMGKWFIGSFIPVIINLFNDIGKKINIHTKKVCRDYLVFWGHFLIFLSAKKNY